MSRSDSRFILALLEHDPLRAQEYLDNATDSLYLDRYFLAQAAAMSPKEAFRIFDRAVRTEQEAALRYHGINIQAGQEQLMLRVGGYKSSIIVSFFSFY